LPSSSHFSKKGSGIGGGSEGARFGPLWMVIRPGRLIIYPSRGQQDWTPSAVVPLAGASSSAPKNLRKGLSQNQLSLRLS